MNYDIPTLTHEAVSLLQDLIAIPSISREEEKAADCLQQAIELQGMNLSLIHISEPTRLEC